jgi:hypothetical protein
MYRAAIRPSNRAWIAFIVFGVALLAAAAVARPYAGGWNDGSRLATVESLVDCHTLAIDQSIFARPSIQITDGPTPYGHADLLSATFGTGDKLYIDGHFYSDKSPVPALALSLAYVGIQQTFGLHAADRADIFCRFLTILSSGLAFAIAAVAMLVLFQELGVNQGLALAATASFGLSTMALTYAEHVNNHSLFLGVSALLMLALFRWSRQRDNGESGLVRLGWIGCLVGAGYSIDLGVGPALIATSGMFVLYRTRALPSLAAFGCAMAPWLLLHHAVNFAVGGSLGPANANAAYFQWPGCSFNSQNMTGGWHHASLGEFGLYAFSLLFGKRGFVGHNLPLFLAFPAGFALLRQRSRETPLVIFAISWCVLTWLMYGVNSTNSSGQCCSIRWFLPLLAPGFFVTVLALRDRPGWQPAFWVLSAWGALLASQMLQPGPWMQHMVPLFWQIQGAAYASILILVVFQAFRARQDTGHHEQFGTMQGKAA